jgi:hypothetical protein
MKNPRGRSSLNRILPGGNASITRTSKKTGPTVCVTGPVPVSFSLPCPRCSRLLNPDTVVFSRLDERPIQGRCSNWNPRPRAPLARLALPRASGTNPSGSKSDRSARSFSGLKFGFCQPKATRARRAVFWDFPAGTRVRVLRRFPTFAVPGIASDAAPSYSSLSDDRSEIGSQNRK